MFAYLLLSFLCSLLPYLFFLLTQLLTQRKNIKLTERRTLHPDIVFPQPNKLVHHNFHRHVNIIEKFQSFYVFFIFQNNNNKNYGKY